MFYGDHFSERQTFRNHICLRKYGLLGQRKKVSRSKRILIGRVDKDTGDIVPTDGRCKKNSPYRKPTKTPRDEIMDRIRPMGVSELRKEVIRLEIELTTLKAGSGRPKDEGTE